MDIRNCRKCGKIYNYDGFNICRSCRQKQEEEFTKVKDFLHEFPGAGISEVEDATGVDSETIMTFLRQGRLEMSADSQIELGCERCGTRVLTGRFCNKCTNEMHSTFSSQYAKKEEVQEVKPKDKKETTILDRYKRN